MPFFKYGKNNKANMSNQYALLLKSLLMIPTAFHLHNCMHGWFNVKALRPFSLIYKILLSYSWLLRSNSARISSIIVVHVHFLLIFYFYLNYKPALMALHIQLIKELSSTLPSSPIIIHFALKSYEIQSWSLCMHFYLTIFFQRQPSWPIDHGVIRKAH